MKTLVINTFGGSLLVGARSLGADIIGSYEHNFYGSDIQAANFPGVPIVRHRNDWPSQDLRDTVVIAHPPCSWASLSNSSPAARGLNSQAFNCTKIVLHYAMEHGAAAIGVESVVNALGQAWNLHDHYADAYGYHVYRILENGAMFGAQWRERFWALWVRKDLAPPTLTISLKPKWQTVQQAIQGHEDGPAPGDLERLVERQKAKLRDELGLTPEEMSFYFDPQDPPHPTIGLDNLLWENTLKARMPEAKPKDRHEITKRYVPGFNSSTFMYLNPNGLAPVLMAGSNWYVNGRSLSEDGFKRIGGFPADYVFPEKPKNYRRNMRAFLSQGVMPPIAAWLLEVMARHLDKTAGLNLEHPEGEGAYTLDVDPGHIADFRIRKEHWLKRDEAMPPLRHFDDRQSEVILQQNEPMNSEIKSIFITARDTIRSLDPTVPILSEMERLLTPPPPPAPVPSPKTARVAKPKTHLFDANEEGRCAQCGEENEHSNHRQRTQVMRVTRMSGQKIEVVTTEGLGTDKTGQRRAAMLDIIRELGQPTLDEAVVKCIETIPILPTTCRWHIRQMMAGGQVKEAP